jgi:hypothetical protein
MLNTVLEGTKFTLKFPKRMSQSDLVTLAGSSKFLQRVLEKERATLKVH